MTTTLVTGGAGYIGCHIVAALCEAGRNAVVIDDFSGSSPRAVDALRRVVHAAVPVVEGDVADRDHLAAAIKRYRVNSVIHLAALKSVTESLVDPLRYYRNNLACTVNVAETAVEHGVERLVFSSSASVYGTPQSVPVTEDEPLTPISPYGRTKLMGEQILTDSAAASHLDTVLLRYFNPVGAHPSGLIGEDATAAPGNLVPRVLQTALGLRGPVPVFGCDYDTPDGTAVRDFIHVVDLAEGHLAALENYESPATAHPKAHSAVYNLGTGVGSSVLEVLAAAAAAVGETIPHETADRRPGDMASIWADCQKARHELGWSAHHDLASMLQDHWNWQRSHPDGYRRGHCGRITLSPFMRRSHPSDRAGTVCSCRRLARSPICPRLSVHPDHHLGSHRQWLSLWIAGARQPHYRF